MRQHLKVIVSVSVVFSKLTTSFFIFLQSLIISRTPRTFICRESLLGDGRKLEGRMRGRMR